MENLKKLRAVLHDINTITEYLEDMGVLFYKELEPDNFAEMELITGLSSLEVMEILNHLFKVFQEGGE